MESLRLRFLSDCYCCNYARQEQVLEVQEQAMEVRSFWDVLPLPHEETPAARR